mgnify:CR=1 FL=1
MVEGIVVPLAAHFLHAAGKIESRQYGHLHVDRPAGQDDADPDGQCGGEGYGSGIGRRLVETLVHDAGMLGLRRVFALTLQDGFFHRLGFETTVVSEFPEKVAADCSTCARRATCTEIAVARNVTH